jgi:hypothetical protein
METARLIAGLLIAGLFAVTPSLAQNVPEPPHAPASLPCGIVNPHIQYMVTADVGWNKSGGLDRFDSPVAGTTLQQNSGDGFPYNGQGAANASVRTLCLLVFPGDEHNVYTSLHLTTDTMAQSGCCGGLQPGGQVYSQPEWQSSLILPGSDDDSHWTLKVTLNTQITSDNPSNPKPSGKCVVRIDGDATGHELDQTQPSASFTEHVNSGPHVLNFQCSQFGLNVRGVGAVVQRNVHVDQTLYLSASNSDSKQAKKPK